MVLTEGQQFTHTLHVTHERVQQFANVSGDHNPLHLDDDFAATTRFGGRIAHGMLVGSLVVATLGEDFPGAIHLSQTFKFKKPVYVGTTVTVVLTVTHWRDDRGIATLALDVQNPDGETVLDGETVVMLPKG